MSKQMDSFWYESEKKCPADDIHSCALYLATGNRKLNWKLNQQKKKIRNIPMSGEGLKSSNKSWCNQIFQNHTERDDFHFQFASFNGHVAFKFSYQCSRLKHILLMNLFEIDCDSDLDAIFFPSLGILVFPSIVMRHFDSAFSNIF